MADRHFPNEMPDSVAENPEEDHSESGSHSRSLWKLLSMPYESLSKHFEREALDLKEAVVMETWGRTEQRVEDFSLYAGTLGTAFLLLKAYGVTKNENDLTLCSQIVKACDSASLASRNVSFICGRAGVCALGAVVANCLGDESSLNSYIARFNEVSDLIVLPKNLPDELLYGRVGYLWACLYLNKSLGEGTVPMSVMRPVLNEVFKNGRAMGRKAKCPLMYEWHGKKYWGAAHGLAGIMHVLMDMDLTPDEAEDVKGTLKYMIKNRLPSGNYPSSEDNKERDVLLHWCHGAPGVLLTLVKAASVFGEEEFLKAAIEASETVWHRGLLRRVGMCHGISGNAYVFLSLYRSTGDVKYLYKAKAFACFLLDGAHKLIAQGEMHGGDRHYSLFEGIGGMAYLFLDMFEPSGARFPAYEL